MNRRSFLKMAGLTAAMSHCATARHILLLNAEENSPISRIEWIVYATGRRNPASEPEHRCVVRIGAVCGVQGWVDAPISAMPDQDTAGLVRNALLGQDLGRHDAIWRQFYEQNIPLGVLSAVDIALWDLWGRLMNKPVHALLDTKRQKVKACVATNFNLGEPERYAEAALACKEAGVHGCKIRPYVEWGAGRNGLANAGFPDRDMAVYQAVRDAVGADYACMADNLCTYTYDEALRVGRMLDDLNYQWYESPMPETDDWRQRYTALAGELRTPICAPETEPDSYPPRISWIGSKACDISRIDASLGGFTACLELALACEAAGVPLTLHDLGPDSYPHLQLLGATAESLITYMELGSLSQNACTLPGRATPEPVFDNEGCVAIGQTPGMGLELDWKYIYASRVA